MGRAPLSPPTPTLAHCTGSHRSRPCSHTRSHTQCGQWSRSCWGPRPRPEALLPAERWPSGLRQGDSPLPGMPGRFQVPEPSGVRVQAAGVPLWVLEWGQEGRGWAGGWGALPCAGRAECIWPQKGWLAVSAGGCGHAWDQCSPCGTPPGGEAGALQAGCPRGDLSVDDPDPPGSIQSQSMAMPPHIRPGQTGALPFPRRQPPKQVARGLVPKSPASSASGAGPDYSPRSRTRAGRIWLGRAMDRPQK